jgi:hypothetical protein
MSWIRKWAQDLGITETENGTWIQAIAKHFGINEPSNGTWIEAISRHQNVPHADIDWKVGLALKKGLILKNASWEHSLMDIFSSGTSGSSGSSGCIYPIQNLEQQVGVYSGYNGIHPFYGLYNYTLSAQIHSPSQFNPTASQITGLSFYTRSFTTPYTVNNQEIWIGEISNTTFAATPKTDFSDLVFVKPLSKVVQKNITLTDNYTWTNITFDTPYCYSGTNNLLIVWKNNDGAWTSGFGQFQVANVSSKGMTAYWDNPTSMPATGTRDNFQTLIKLKY